jgi:hypothetical protein
MKKHHKILLVSLLVLVVALAIGSYLLVSTLWNGIFDFMNVKEIATYNSPDGQYSLVFEQVGDPAWPFGPTDVRLTLKDGDGKRIEQIDAQINDDGANAGEHNVASVTWNDDEVVVVLRASEMKDKEIKIPYNKN